MSSTFSWGPWTSLVVLTAGVLGTGIAMLRVTAGVARAADPKFASGPETKTWIACFSLFVGVSLAAGTALLPEWWNLAHVRPRAAALTIVVAVVLAILGVAAPRAFIKSSAQRRTTTESPEDPPLVLHKHASRLDPLIFIAILALFPAISGMMLAALEAADPTDGDRADTAAALNSLLRLRGTVLLFLGSAALVIVAGVIATAMLRKAAIAARPQEAPTRPASDILLYGGFFSLLLAAVFIPAYLALQDAGEDLVMRALASVEAPPDHAYFEAREDLRTTLGLDVSWAGVFAGAFAVLSPAAAGFVTALITPKDPATTANGAKPDTAKTSSPAVGGLPLPGEGERAQTQGGGTDREAGGS